MLPSVRGMGLSMQITSDEEVKSGVEDAAAVVNLLESEPPTSRSPPGKIRTGLP